MRSDTSMKLVVHHDRKSSYNLCVMMTWILVGLDNLRKFLCADELRFLEPLRFSAVDTLR